MVFARALVFVALTSRAWADNTCAAGSCTDEAILLQNMHNHGMKPVAQHPLQDANNVKNTHPTIGALDTPPGWSLIKENWNCGNTGSGITVFPKERTLAGCALLCEHSPIAGLWYESVGCVCFVECDGGRSTLVSNVNGDSGHPNKVIQLDFPVPDGWKHNGFNWDCENPELHSTDITTLEECAGFCSDYTYAATSVSVGCQCFVSCDEGQATDSNTLMLKISEPEPVTDLEFFTYVYTYAYAYAYSPWCSAGILTGRNGDRQCKDSEDIDSISEANRQCEDSEDTGCVVPQLVALLPQPVTAFSIGTTTDGCQNEYGELIPSVVHTDAAHTASVRCCSNDGSSCETADLEGGCASGQTQAEAIAVCAANDMRLCSESEMAGNICCGSGCGFDDHAVWVDTSGDAYWEYFLARENLQLGLVGRLSR